MKPILRLRDFFPTHRFFLLGAVMGVLLVLAGFFKALLAAVLVFGLVFMVAGLLDFLVLSSVRTYKPPKRLLPERLSLGDQQAVKIRFFSPYRTILSCRIIDELPYALQVRDLVLEGMAKPNEVNGMEYSIRPQHRGIYAFGGLHLFFRGKLGLLERRFSSPLHEELAVYPSFLQLRKAQLRATANRALPAGGRLIQQRGISTEFDHVRDYSRGDDVRTLNWTASARAQRLMVNTFMDEKAQQVYVLIDKGRLMKGRFNGLTLLDHAINATLMLAWVALRRGDRFGLMTYTDRLGDVMPPVRGNAQFRQVMELLYRQETEFPDSSAEVAAVRIRKGIGQRSLLVHFTHFETYNGYRRQAPWLYAMGRKHLLMVVFFENPALQALHHQAPVNLEDIAVRTVADKFSFERDRIVEDLRQHGILALKSLPGELSVDVMNRYLALKAGRRL